MERTLSKESGENNMWKEHYPKEVGKLSCGKEITRKYIGVPIKHQFASNAIQAWQPLLIFS